jgi:small subunit ribosomal protein S8
MDTIADALTRLRNAAKLNKKEVVLKKTNLVRAVADILLKEGFLTSVVDKDNAVIVQIAYDKSVPVMSSMKRVSKSGQRKYVSASELKSVLSGRGIGIISTSRGVMTIDDARKMHIGGEYICEIW